MNNISIEQIRIIFDSVAPQECPLKNSKLLNEASALYNLLVTVFGKNASDEKKNIYLLKYKKTSYDNRGFGIFYPTTTIYYKPPNILESSIRVRFSCIKGFVKEETRGTQQVAECCISCRFFQDSYTTKFN